MNDLDLLRTMRSDTPPPNPDALAHARTRLLDQATARKRWFPPRLRAGWQTAAAATIVIVLGVGAIVSTYERAGGPADRSPPPASSAAPETLQSVLAQAAQAARTAPAVEATEGQYWYFKEVYRVIQPGVGPDEDEMTAEYWYVVGSERAGKIGRIHFEYETGDVLDLVRRNGENVVTQNGQVGSKRTLALPQWFRDDPDPSSRWVPDDVAVTAPTNAADMHDFIRDQFPYFGPGPEFESLIGLLTQQILAPQQRAAAYEALGQLPDLTVVPDAVDITGRHGVGIANDSGGIMGTTVILDTDSGQVLEIRSVMAGEFSPPPGMDAPELQPGSGNAEAILVQGVVDSVDERP